MQSIAGSRTGGIYGTNLAAVGADSAATACWALPLRRAFTAAMSCPVLLNSFGLSGPEFRPAMNRAGNLLHEHTKPTRIKGRPSSSTQANGAMIGTADPHSIAQEIAMLRSKTCLVLGAFLFSVGAA